MSANSKQVGGEHYKSSHQHWDIMAEMYGQGYFKAQITRYIVRWRKKDGLKDLQKAQHYTEKLHELAFNGMQLTDQLPPGLLTKFFAANLLDIKDFNLMAMALQAKSLKDVQKLADELNELITSTAIAKEV